MRRRYRGDTLILETQFTTADGTVRLIDFMPPRGTTPRNEIDVVRLVEGVEGRVEMDMDLTLRFDYGSVVPWVTSPGERLRAVGGPDSVIVDTPVELKGEDQHTVARFTVSQGDRVPFVLTWSPSNVPPPDAASASDALAETERWWSDWAGRCGVEGEHREAVVRSLITLKALTYAPTGGIVAAPTTSLPEQLGGERNWDYRYVWLRDAAFTLYAFLLGGYTEEAVAWRDWLLRAVAGNPEDLRIMYGVAGERRLPELTLPWLGGYAGSKPVRIGNAAHVQTQMDAYGQVMDALWVARNRGLEPEEGAWNLQRALLEFLEGNWKTDDHSLWEVRGPARPFTHSRVMCWVAFDRAIRTVEEWPLEGPVGRWRAARDEIASEVLSRGYDAERNTFVQSYGSKTLDASLLLIPQVGFLPPDDRRVTGTIDAVIEDLGFDDVLVRRYLPDEADDGLPGGEGAFMICSFWLVDALALSGREAEARRRFDGLLALRNDVGLMAEEHDPITGQMLGNFPQAFSHVGLVDSAFTLGTVKTGETASWKDRPSL